MLIKVSRGGMVHAGGKKYYFNAGVHLIPDDIVEHFKPFQDDLDILSERERKLLTAAGLKTKHDVLAVENLVSIQGIGDKTAQSILEKLNGNTD